MYAVVETGGKQFKVSEGDVIKVEKINREPGTEIELPVLMTVEGEKIACGADVEGVKAKAKIVAHGKDKKIIVYKYKPKKNERKKKGHRQQFTTVRIEKIA